MCHHAWLILVSLVETAFYDVGQAGLKLLTPGHLPAWASQSAGITGGLALSPRLECSATIMAHCAFHVSSSSNPPISASLIAEDTEQLTAPTVFLDKHSPLFLGVQEVQVIHGVPGEINNTSTVMELPVSTDPSTTGQADCILCWGPRDGGASHSDLTQTKETASGFEPQGSACEFRLCLCVAFRKPLSLSVCFPTEEPFCID
ncbi:hypothetical protein AAY473_031631 [Plecturocebus cupreus]